MIDNQVHIGHNCKIDDFCILAGQVGLSGSVVLEKNVTVVFNSHSGFNRMKSLKIDKKIILNTPLNSPNGTHNIPVSNPLVNVSCDTTISFTINPGFPTYNSNFDTTLCFGEFVTINGNIYNGANSSGTEVFSSINGGMSAIGLPFKNHS